MADDDAGDKTDNTASSCRVFRISGRVQGVFFRASTRNVACNLGITGHAINLQDGSVEVLACGAPSALDKLADWLHSGPPMAEVSNVQVREQEFEELAGFRVA